MNHNFSGVKLGRNSSHRSSMFRNLLISLVKNEQIKTTNSKAKAIRPVIEKAITISKIDTVQNRRRLMSMINNKSAVEKLFTTLAKNYLDRNGGYTRVIKMGHRGGDSAKLAIIELVKDNNKIDKSLQSV